MINLIPKHDPVEVNKYLMSGLSKSEIDSFFEGPAPDERLLEFFRSKNYSLKLTMADTDKYLKANGPLPPAEVSQPMFEFHPLSSNQASNQDSISFRRNLQSLVELVIVKSSSCFQKAASVATKTAICNSFSLPVKDNGILSDAPKYVIKDWLEWESCTKDVGLVCIGFEI